MTTHQEQAQAAEGQGDYRGAIREWDLVLKDRPGDSDAWFRKADCHVRVGEPDLALAACERALRYDPRHRAAQALLEELRAAGAHSPPPSAKPPLPPGPPVSPASSGGLRTFSGTVKDALRETFGTNRRQGIYVGRDIPARLLRRIRGRLPQSLPGADPEVVVDLGLFGLGRRFCLITDRSICFSNRGVRGVVMLDRVEGAESVREGLFRYSLTVALSSGSEVTIPFGRRGKVCERAGRFLQDLIPAASLARRRAETPRGTAPTGPGGDALREMFQCPSCGETFDLDPRDHLDRFRCPTCLTPLGQLIQRRNDEGRLDNRIGALSASAEGEPRLEMALQLLQWRVRRGKTPGHLVDTWLNELALLITREHEQNLPEGWLAVTLSPERMVDALAGALFAPGDADVHVQPPGYRVRIPVPARGLASVLNAAMQGDTGIPSQWRRIVRRPLRSLRPTRHAELRIVPELTFTRYQVEYVRVIQGRGFPAGRVPEFTAVIALGLEELSLNRILFSIAENRDLSPGETMEFRPVLLEEVAEQAAIPSVLSESAVREVRETRDSLSRAAAG